MNSMNVRSNNDYHQSQDYSNEPSWYHVNTLPYGIVWYITTCASLTRWVLELAFQVSISLQSGPVGKLNRSNQIQLYSFSKTALSGLNPTIREKYVWDGV
jgi:hypothetical protein